VRGVSKPPAMLGVRWLGTHSKANRHQRILCSDGSWTAGSWPQFRDFLVVPYGLHRGYTDDKYRVVARSRQPFRLGARGKDGCPGDARIILSARVLGLLFSFFFSHQKVRKDGVRT
jgi:hypothetical protein